MVFPASHLSQENVLRDVHDPVTQTLRTTATAVIAPGLDVDIDHTEDSIRLGDGTNFFTSTNVGGDIGLDVNIINTGLQISDGTDILQVNPDGSINVSLVTNTNTYNTYNEVLSVANNTLTTIVTYIAPTTGKLSRASASGSNVAVYSVLLNGNVISKKYTYFSSDMSVDFEFENISLIAGNTVQVKVIHYRPQVGDFNANIIILED